MTLVKRNFPTLGRFFDDDWFDTPLTNGDWSPAINVIENNDTYEIEVAAPGIKKEDFNVSVEDGHLIISGQNKVEDEDKNKNFTRKEFSYRSFTKSFKLPQNTNEEGISAKHKDGILKLTLKKHEEQLPPKKNVVIE